MSLSSSLLTSYVYGGTKYSVIIPFYRICSFLLFIILVTSVPRLSLSIQPREIKLVYCYSSNFLVMAPTKDRAGAARCEPFSTWALPTVLQGKKKHPRRAGEGIKRCRSTRVYKERIDPRLEFPRSRDFESRYRLPPKMVKFLTDEFQASPFCPTKMEYGDKGRPIPLFNKVSIMWWEV